MGIYWTTYFVCSAKPCNQILLSGMNRILDDDDKARGYVRKEDLLRIFANRVKPEDIKRNSYIVEYESTTYEGGAKSIEAASCLFDKRPKIETFFVVSTVGFTKIMDYSFASYLLPAAAQANKSLCCRVKFADQHLDFQYGPRGYEVKTNKGTLLRKEEQGSYKTGYTTTKPDPMTGPISEVLQKHCGLDPSGIKLEEFQIIQLVEKKVEYNPQNYTYHNYNRPPIYEEGSSIVVDWSNPWKISGQTSDLLKEMCKNNRDILQSLVAEIQQSWTFDSFSRLEAGYYRAPRHIQLKAPGKPLSPRCVFLKSGAIFDYNEQKVVATNLDTWLCEYLGLESAAYVTWGTIYNHLLVNHVGMPTALAAAKIKVDTLEQRRQRDHWRQVGYKIRASMPYLNVGTYSAKGTLQLLALNKSTATLQTYFLDVYGIRRSFEETVQPKRQLTAEEQAKRQDWFRPFSEEAAKALAAMPDTQWFAQVVAKWTRTQFEPIDLLSCL